MERFWNQFKSTVHENNNISAIEISSTIYVLYLKIQHYQQYQGLHFPEQIMARH